MTASTLPVLYSFRRCPYAMRARLAWLASQQVGELREVVLARKPAAMLAASPKGTVPVLVLPDGQVIDQSLEIMLWALRQHDPLNWLGDDVLMPEMLQWVARCDSEFKRHLDRYKYPNRFGLPDGMLHRDQGAVFLMELNERLATSAYLSGSIERLVDAALAPFVRQFAHTDPTWFANQAWPHLRAWLTQFEASSAYLAVMQKFDAWTPGQALQRFPSLPSDSSATI
jgi:glutathione S-transferase